MCGTTPIEWVRYPKVQLLKKGFAAFYEQVCRPILDIATCASGRGANERRHKSSWTRTRVHLKAGVPPHVYFVCDTRSTMRKYHPPTDCMIEYYGVGSFPHDRSDTNITLTLYNTLPKHIPG